MEDSSIEQLVPTPEPAASYKTLVVYTLIALTVAIFVRFFVAAPYIVSGASMEPTFDSWHYLIVDRLSYEIGEPQRGDVIVFEFPQDPTRSFIKRVIGLPGETVVLSGTKVEIQNEEHPKGFILDEPYIAEELERPSFITVTLGSDEYFVLGDNRLESADSRVWGTLQRDFIAGRAYVRLFPFSQLDILPGEARYNEQ